VSCEKKPACGRFGQKTEGLLLAAAWHFAILNDERTYLDAELASFSVERDAVPISKTQKGYPCCRTAQFLSAL
jgi:hypothetical protein